MKDIKTQVLTVAFWVTDDERAGKELPIFCLGCQSDNQLTSFCETGKLPSFIKFFDEDLIEQGKINDFSKVEFITQEIFIKLNEDDVENLLIVINKKFAERLRGKIMNLSCRYDYDIQIHIETDEVLGAERKPYYLFVDEEKEEVGYKSLDSTALNQMVNN